MISEKGLIKLSRWPLGINNMAEEIALDRDQFGRIVALAEAVNVDITAEGIVKRRAGQTIVDDAPYHSLYCYEFGFGLCVTGGALHRLNEDGTIVSLVGGMSMYDDVTYAELSDRIFWSNNTKNGIVMANGATRELGVEVPTQPVLTPTATGGMNAGTYQVVLAFRDGFGERSGTEEPIEIEVPQNGGIMVSAIPQSDTAVACEVFITTAGGGTAEGYAFYRIASIPAGIDEYMVGGKPTGFQLDSLMCEPVPPASIYRLHHGRLLYATGNLLGWSKALRPTLCDPTHDLQRFAQTVTMIEPLSQVEGSGVYVAAAGRTFWLDGADPRASGGWKLREAHPYGAVAGSSLLVPAKAFDEDAQGRYAYWLDTGGHFCIGKPGGVVQRIGERRFNAGVTDKAASVYREANGSRHVITSMRGDIQRDNFKMQDSLGVKLVRRAQA